MVRLYYEIVERLYLILIWVKYIEGFDFKRIESQVASFRPNLPNKYEQICVNEANKILAYGGTAEYSSIDGLLDVLTKIILNKNKKAEGEGDLIDLIVTSLQSPFTGSVLSGRTISNLRKALLLPEELAGLKQRLMQKERTCESCGKAIEPGEAMVLSPGSGEHAAMVTMCFACIKPTFVHCDKCGESVDFNDLYATKRSKGCETHKKKETTESDPDSRPTFSVSAPPGPVTLRTRPRDRGLRSVGGEVVGFRSPVRAGSSGQVRMGDSVPPPSRTVLESFWADSTPAIGVDIETSRDLTPDMLGSILNEVPPTGER